MSQVRGMTGRSRAIAYAVSLSAVKISTLEHRWRPSRDSKARRLAYVKDRSRRIWRHAERARRPSAVRAAWRGKIPPPAAPCLPPQNTVVGGGERSRRSFILTWPFLLVAGEPARDLSGWEKTA